MRVLGSEPMGQPGRVEPWVRPRCEHQRGAAGRGVPGCPGERIAEGAATGERGEHSGRACFLLLQALLLPCLLLLLQGEVAHKHVVLLELLLLKKQQLLLLDGLRGQAGAHSLDLPHHASRTSSCVDQPAIGVGGQEEAVRRGLVCKG